MKMQLTVALQHPATIMSLGLTSTVKVNTINKICSPPIDLVFSQLSSGHAMPRLLVSLRCCCAPYTRE